MTLLVTPISGVLQTAGRQRQVTEISDGNYSVQLTDHIISVVAPLLVPLRLPFEAPLGTTIEVNDGLGTAFTTPIIVSGNGALINGAPTTTIATNYGRMIFTKGSVEWAGSFVDEAAASAAEAAEATEVALLAAAPLQPVWYIDGQNVSGNASDTNDGASVATPLLTHTELERRLRGQTILPPIVMTPVPFPPFSIGLRPWTVFIMSNLPVTDPVGLQCTFGPDVMPRYIGLATVVTSSGTFAAVNATAAAARRAANSVMTVTDVARAGLPWELYQRIRITGGPRVGSIAFVAENLGADQCATLEFARPAPYPFYAAPLTSLIAPAATDPYVVESLTQIALKSDWNQTFTGNSTTVLSALPVIGFKDIKVVNSTNGLQALKGVVMAFEGCQINPNAVFNDTVCTFKSTAFLNAAFFLGGVNTILSGGAFESGGGAGVPGYTVEMFLSNGALMRVDADAMCYGGPSWHLSNGALAFTALLATFKATAKASHAASGFGMSLPPAASWAGGNQIGFGFSRFWGSGNANKGAYVYPGATMHWGDPAFPATSLVPTCTGTLGDFSSGLTTDNVSTTIDPAADPPVWLPKRTNSWAELNNPLPSATAFGGTAINAIAGSRITIATKDL